MCLVLYRVSEPVASLSEYRKILFDLCFQNVSECKAPELDNCYRMCLGVCQHPMDS